MITFDFTYKSQLVQQVENCGGDSYWQREESTTTLSPLNDGDNIFTLGNISGAIGSFDSLQVTNDIQADSINVTNQIQAGSVVASGSVSGASGSFTSLSAGSINSTGTISGVLGSFTNLTYTELLQGVNAVLTGSLSCLTGSVTGQFQVDGEFRSTTKMKINGGLYKSYVSFSSNGNQDVGKVFHYLDGSTNQVDLALVDPVTYDGLTATIKCLDNTNRVRLTTSAGFQIENRNNYRMRAGESITIHAYNGNWWIH
jgi:hypothetical protein